MNSRMLMAAALIAVCCVCGFACTRLTGVASGDGKPAVSTPDQSTGHRGAAEPDQPPAFLFLPPEGG